MVVKNWELKELRSEKDVAKHPAIVKELLDRFSKDDLILFGVNEEVGEAMNLDFITAREAFERVENIEDFECERVLGKDIGEDSFGVTGFNIVY